MNMPLLAFTIRFGRWYRRKWCALLSLPARAASRLNCVGTRPVFMAPLSCKGEGNVILGDRVVVGYDGGACLGTGEVRLHAAAGVNIRVGARTHFNNNVQVFASASVTIGADCLIGDAVLIMDSDGHALAPEARHQLAGASSAVTIEDNVWIGSRAIILKGVTLGAGCVVGAGAVVTRSVPPRTVVGGNPARPIRKL
jgi:maltose O-acetyltransferase